MPVIAPIAGEENLRAKAISHLLIREAPAYALTASIGFAINKATPSQT
ncbi:hypothetical protein [Nostoc parmelioides]|uniref:Uncharacterized protein n=1 Tax=Nostoc parmelioides FACHB-3921 TaxID=2692909 RepID=A0ABR8B9M2_9NOSO|nr:hypothetical protein [Nostoc parmelioides]MBD2250802.1 hypothetical protein [Nostoc parmelioides FACHB-3921]